MKLSDLNNYSRIVIQCHDNPDPDSIGAGYALYKFFENENKEVSLIYSGKLKITKPNILMLIEEFDIPIQYVEKIDIEGLLITVDCQYGAGNVTKLNARDIAIIDHHLPEVDEIARSEIRSFLASTCTLVWDLISKESFNINEHIDIATALYYGLFTDSGGFSEINHPLDKDMQESLIIDNSVMRKLKSSVLTLRELEIAGMALIRHSYNVVNKFVLVKAQECDPNILGFISDLALQVDSVYVCVVYNQINRGIKFSVRSCVKEIMANELAAYLAEGIGSGGGHIEKAGGFISQKEFDKRHAYLNADEYFLRRLTRYYRSFDVIYSIEDYGEIDDMQLYKKRALPVGFVPLTDILPDNTPIVIRTLEGDLDLLANQDIYAMIGIKGEVYPTTKEKFEKNYTVLEEQYDLELEYFPSIRNKKDSSTIHLRQYAKKCISKGESYIYARPLKKAVKVFTAWDREKYMYGKIGDYLAVKKDDNRDIYVIEKEIFAQTYDKL
ncbi:DHH family phosphoesterase [Cellulosilyticum sp. I15G10I2]|uniref:DHH family phosphoesterase n=1 Tax=Cellulosilyticum sp. I15G10I2 TaxID=1892843 RepID=UPI00085CD30E|nr:DHH family phosphoesterase [Cellulosilyticum sp. I15G10I2]